MTLQITGPYLAILALYAIILGAIVSIHRAKSGISILHGDDNTLAEKMRRHGNFTENVPLALLLMAVAEIQGLSSTWLHAAGILLLASRIIHPMGIQFENPRNVLRGIGSSGTLLAMLICIVFIIRNRIGF